MSIPHLSTKLYIPPPRAQGVPRPRLTEKMASAVLQPGCFLLLAGPAGFGKTTLLSEFAARRSGQVAWLSLDDSDNDPIRWWTDLIAACQTVQPAMGASIQALIELQQPPPLEALPVLFINDLDRLETDLLLILDDYHVIQNEAIHAGLLFLLDHLPKHLRLILSTRVDPPWPLTRFLARNQMVEIRARDLQFNREEAAAFLNQTMGLNLSPADVAALEARTEGWAAGLQLAALSMRGRSDLAGFIKAFTGSHAYVAEYLLEEVLRRQPPHVQSFLLQTSVLERLSAGLCAAASGRDDAQELLADLHQSNLFVIPLDDDNRWFRYHHLFSDLLKARLQQTYPPQAIAEIHQRAAAWYDQAGIPTAAMEHALAAADYPLAVRLIGKSALPMILQAYVRTVEDWLRAIPQRYITASPQANLAFAWLCLLRGAFAQATPYLEQLTRLFSDPATAQAEPVLYAEWLAIQSKLLNVQGQAAQSRDLALQALEILPAEYAAVRSMILVNLATAYGQMLDYDHAIEIFELMVQDARAAGDTTIEILGIAGQGQMLVQQGRLRRAAEIATRAIQRIEATGAFTPFSATLYGELGQVHYQWNKLEQAQRYFLRSAETSGHSGYSDPEIYRHIMLSRVAQVAGDAITAAQEMELAADLARRNPPAMVREEVIAQQVRIHLANGRIAAARDLLQPAGFQFEPRFSFPDLPPGGSVPHPLGLLYNCAFRVLLIQSREKQPRQQLPAALDLAGKVLAGELQCQHIPIAIETLLLRAQMRAALGAEPDGLPDVIAALQLGEPEGFISLFVEEGAPVANALRALARTPALLPVQPGYLQAILAAFPAAPAPQVAETLVEALTHREMEVLRLIAAGDSNQAIAAKLVITLSAVKKHTGNIYGKLNVSSRTQAVAHARQLGLLPDDE